MTDQEEHRPSPWGHRGEGTGHRRPDLSQATLAPRHHGGVLGLGPESAPGSSQGEGGLAATAPQLPPLVAHHDVLGPPW
jgi:hypothetical protein